MRVCLGVASAALMLGACIVVQGEPAVVHPPGSAAPPGYTAMAPVSCSGSQDVHLRAAYIRTSGVAVQVAGGCDVVIEDSQIVSDAAAAVVVSGGGDVKVRRSLVQGAQASFALSGGADVIVEHSRIVGPVQRGGGAGLRDRGGNTWQ